ncbi:beta-N-acetylhexosaminidase [soil metagenome]
MTDLIQPLSTEQKIGQLFVIGIPGPEIDVETTELLDEIDPGGICLFARNIREARQTRDLTDQLRKSLQSPIIAVDQEGGLVDRLRRILSPMPAASRILSADDSKCLAGIVSEALRTLGMNMDFAPVVDIVDHGRAGFSNGLASRTFGASKEETAELAGEFLSVLQANGIIGCLKHFPGLGAAEVDSHEELPAVNISEEELRSVDLYPYRQLIASGDVHAVMVAHAAFPEAALQEFDQNGKLLPSSLSYNIVTNLLRDELQFDGLVITDDLEMGAIVKNYGVGDACKRAINVGVDMLAICAEPSAIREGYFSVLAAANEGEIEMGRIDTSLGRIATLKRNLTEPLPFDSSRLNSLSTEIAEFTERLSRI